MSALTYTEDQGRSRVPLLIVGYGLALICLVWVLHDFHLMQAMREMANVKWDWVLLGIGCDLFSYGIQALRWRKFLLAPFGEVRLSRSIRAVYAGLCANFVFPLRPGEFLRSYLLSDSEDITLVRVLGSVGVERFMDLVIATASLAVVSLLVDLPRRFQRVADTLGVVTLVLLSIVVIPILYLEVKLGTNPRTSKVAHASQAARKGHGGAVTDLHAMGTAPSFYPAGAFASLVIPVCQVLGHLWSMMAQYGLQSVVSCRSGRAADH